MEGAGSLDLKHDSEACLETPNGRHTHITHLKPITCVIAAELPRPIAGLVHPRTPALAPTMSLFQSLPPGVCVQVRQLRQLVARRVDARVGLRRLQHPPLERGVAHAGGADGGLVQLRVQRGVQPLWGHAGIGGRRQGGQVCGVSRLGDRWGPEGAGGRQADHHPRALVM